MISLTKSSLLLPMPSSSASSSASTRSTSSSLSSTFSDLSVDSSTFSAASSSAAASSSPPAPSKTHAFFTSSFAASPPPRPPPSVKQGDGDLDSAPTPSIPSPTKSARFHVSRIFPSRFTSTSRDSSERNDLEHAFSSHNLRRKPDFLFIDHDTDSTEHDQAQFRSQSHTRDQSLGEILLPFPSPRFEDERSPSDTSYSSASSISSSSSHVEIRLPSPPPPLSTSVVVCSTDDEATPRPADLEPSIYAFERDIKPTSLTFTPPDSNTSLIDAEPREGTMISNMTYPSIPAVTASSPPLSLRLVHALGQGAFSAVWLAEDLSSVPLALTSKQSIRDLRTKASLNSKGALSRDSSLKNGAGSMSRNSSLKKFKSRVRGTRPSLGRSFLDERDGVGAGSPIDTKLQPSWGVDEEGRLLPSSSSASLHQSQTSSPSPPFSSSDINLTASLSRNNSTRKRASSSSTTRLVAVKLTPRRPTPYSAEAEERTRVGFVREVEVLRHISHPNITPLFSYLSTLTHHVLVLPYLRGGDLLGLVNSDEAWGRLSEGVLKRIWCEICRGVGWMHSVGLVHRDVKLENVLLTWEGLTHFEQMQTEDVDKDADPNSEERRSTSVSSSTRTITKKRENPLRLCVSDLPTPLIKLTDFGLSRFIDIGNGERGSGEMLTTRCGSEAYAAPELVMGSSSISGLYDARETDAWACGVVLYALVGRKLPFGEGVGMDAAGAIASHGSGSGSRRSSKIGGERVHTTQNMGHVGGARAAGRKHLMERRQWLMRIARGEYEWPQVSSELTPSANKVEDDDDDDDGELVGPRLALSEGAKRIVGRLLIRDPRKRARILELWDDEWMREDFVGLGVWENLRISISNANPEGDAGTTEGWVEGMGSSRAGERVWDTDVEGDGSDRKRKAEEGLRGVGEDDWEPLNENMMLDREEHYEGSDEEGEDEGWLLDHEGIGSIARQEIV